MNKGTILSNALATKGSDLETLAKIDL